MRLKVVACGFNAHGQLLSPDHQAPVSQYHIIDDLSTPTVIANAKESVRVIFAGWAETLLEIDNKLYVKGVTDPHRKAFTLETPDDFKPVLMAFGEPTSLSGVLGCNHKPLVLGPHPINPKSLCLRPSDISIEDISKIAIAGNGNVCMVRSSNKISVYRNLSGFLDQKEPQDEWDFSNITKEIVDLKSNETAFTILTAIGTIYTFGDQRHNNFGRDLEITPGYRPGLVDALDGVPIAKISSGGWITAAVSVERDLYIWGGRAGDQEQIKDLRNLKPDAVHLVDLDGGLDVVCASVGSGHLAALTVDGRVWAVGRGDNGQTGTKTNCFQEEWKELVIPPIGGKAVEVVCGGWSTFIIVEQP